MIAMRGPNKHYTQIMLMIIFMSTSFYGNVNSDVDAITVRASELNYPLLVIDDFGRNVTIPKFPERIVSLAPSATEILFAIGAGDRVVGVTEYCDHPSEVLELVDMGMINIVGGYQNPNIEMIISLQPDLVVSATMLQSGVILNLEKKGLVVIGLNPRNIDQILSNIELIGLASGQVEIAERLVYSLGKRTEYINSRVGEASHEARVYYELWFDPLMTSGHGTWIDEIIRLGGGVNIFHDTQNPYPTINPEEVIYRNPELIIVPLQYMGTTSIEAFRDRPGWSSIDAIKKERIFEVDEDLVLRPGPRIIDGLEQVASLIHPELYTGVIKTGRNTILSTNSSITRYIYDEDRKLINFTVNGPEVSTGFLNITFTKSMIDGSPIVLFDGLEIPFELSQNENHYSICFSYEHSLHYVTIGGASTIPEFEILLMPLAITIIVTLIVVEWYKPRRNHLRRASATFRS